MAGHERHPGVVRRLFGAAGNGRATSEARAGAVFVTRCLTAQLIALSTLVHAPLPADRDAALQGHSLALHSAVPRPSRARRLSGGAGQLRGVSAVCLGPRRQGRAAAPSAILINYCALSLGRKLGSSLTSTCVCMRWPRGPTLSFLGGPAEVQPFGPLRAFLAGELSAAPAGGLYGLLAGLPLARRKLGDQEAYARRGAQSCNLTPNSVLIRYFVPLVAKRLHKRGQLLQTMLHIGPASLKAQPARDSAPIHQLQRFFCYQQWQLCERVIAAVSAAQMLSCDVCRRGRL